MSTDIDAEIDVPRHMASDLMARAREIGDGGSAEQLRAQALCNLLDGLLHQVGQLRKELRDAQGS